MTYSNSWYKKEYLLGLGGLGGGAGGILVAGGPITSSSDGYQIKNSIRFNSGDEPEMIRRLSKGNARIFTLSIWTKRNKITPGTYELIFGAGAGNSGADGLFWNDDTLYMSAGDDDGSTTAMFRDPSAWYHIVASVDTTQAVGADRVKLYVNGVNYTHTNITTTQHDEPRFNLVANTVGFGRRPLATSSPFWYNGQIADVQLIDGLALGPAAFGEFTSANLWNPKTFALPAPNKGVTHSSTLVCTIDGSSASFNGGNGPTLAFNGIAQDGVQNWANVLSTGAGQVVKMTFTPATAISAPTTLRMHTYTGDSGDPVYVTFNGNGRTRSLLDLGYATGQSMVVDVTELLPEGEDLTSITVDRTSNSAGDGSPIGGIEVDGVLLIDGKTDPTERNNVNIGTTWSTGVTYGGDSFKSGSEAAKGFDGDLTTRIRTDASSNNGLITFTPSSPISYNNSIRAYNGTGSATMYSATWSLNGGSATSVTADGWINIASGSGTLTSLSATRNGDGEYFSAIEIDGNILIDASLDNSFHLKFDDTTSLRTLGYSQLMNTPTGAQPMYGPGADDSSKSSLVLALPGYDLNDHSATIKGSGSNKTVTASGATVESTTGQSKFYGKCLKFSDDGSNDVLSIANNEDLCDFGSGNFTMEAWIKPTKVSDSMFIMGCSKNGTNPNRRGPMLFVSASSDNEIRFEYSTGGTHAAYINDGAHGAPQDQWTHVAVVRNGNDCKLYLNGTQEGSTLDVSSISTAADNNDDPFTIGHNSDQSWGAFDGYMQDVRVYKGAAKYTANFIPPVRNDFATQNLTNAVKLVDTAGSFSGGALYSGSYDNVFDSIQTSAPAYTVNTSSKWTFTTPLAVTGTVRLKVSHGSSGTTSAKDFIKVGYNDGSETTYDCGVYPWASPDWIELSGSSAWSTIEYFDLNHAGSGQGPALWRVEIDGSEIVKAAGTNASIDVGTDTPTNYGTDGGSGGEVRGNFATWNPLDLSAGSLSDGSLAYTGAGGGSNFDTVRATVALTGGKYYWETPIAGSNMNYLHVGIMRSDQRLVTGGSDAIGQTQYANSVAMVCYLGDVKESNTVRHNGDAIAQNDVLMHAFDSSTGKYWIGVNGTWRGATQSEVNSGTNPVYTVSTDYTWVPAISEASTQTSVSGTNFGQRAWKYPSSVPTDYKALCTQNLSDTFGDNDDTNNPSKYFDVMLWNGTGAEKDIKGFNFQPDLAWIKNRDSTNGQMFTDAVRGATKVVYGHFDLSEDTEAQSVKSFLSDGYKIGTFANNNTNVNDYASWNWDAGTAAVTPSSSYNITPTGQWVNSTSGFSITGYTGNGTANQTIPHGLSAAPDLIIVKGRSFQINWPVYHSGVAANKGLFLDLNNQANTWVGGGDNVTSGGIQSVNSNTWTTAVGATNDHNVNKSGETYISYAWSAVPGYSAFGTYTGNGNDNGTFVYLGFRPKFVMIKRLDSSGQWAMLDSERDKMNPISAYMYADAHTAEATDWNFIDILSNGFKNRKDGTYHNTSGGSYAYMAWAEHPYKTSRAF